MPGQKADAMKLRKPCPHDLYDRHHLSEGLQVGDLTHCPGGVFLPDNALVIEKENGEWKLPFELGLFGPDGAPVNVQEMFDALSVREAEPEVDKNQMGMW